MNLLEKSCDEFIEAFQLIKADIVAGRYEFAKTKIEILMREDSEGDDCLSRLRNMISDEQLEEAMEFSRSCK